MTEQLNRLLAELQRKLEDARTADPSVADPGDDPGTEPVPVDFSELSEAELDREMNRRLASLHELLPPDPAAVSIVEDLPPAQGPIGRLKRRLRYYVRRQLQGDLQRQRHFHAVLLELALASYIRLRQHEARLDALAERIAGREEDQLLERRRREAAAGQDPANAV